MQRESKASREPLVILHSDATFCESSNAPVSMEMDFEGSVIRSTYDLKQDLCPSFFSCFGSMICFPTWTGGCGTLQQSDAAVVSYFGKVHRVIVEPGLYCLNPCGRDIKTMSTKQWAKDLDPVKVLDARGNPIIISGVVVAQITNPVKAAMTIDDPHTYVVDQAKVVLKQMASQYPYEADDDVDEPSLKTEALSIASEMTRALQMRIEATGMRVLSFSLSDLSYAPEIASAMLVKQQANALIQARKMIVAGAVDIAHSAVVQLESRGVGLSDSEKARMVTNLLSVICGDANVTPTLPLS